MSDVCEWLSTEDFDGDPFYETNCGESFCFIEGDVKYNGIKYCPYCGRPIRVIEEEKDAR
jgi:hypothetical protein